MCQIQEKLLKLIYEKGSPQSIAAIAKEIGVASELIKSMGEKFADITGGAIKCDSDKFFSGRFLLQNELLPMLIEACVEGRMIGKEVMVFPETDSTNDVAWGYAGQAENSGVIVLAESQRAGRGRFSDRSWYDVPGNSILMSVLVDAELVDGEILSPLLSLAVAKSLKNDCCIDVGIKWPNDVLAGGKKVSGIMVESRVVKGRQWYVLGIGINCNQGKGDFPEYLTDIATSVYIESGEIVHRNILVVSLVNKIDKLLSGCIDRESICREWMELNCDLGREVSVISDGDVYQGEVLAVEPMSGITLKFEDGKTKFFDARTISLVPLKGKY